MTLKEKVSILEILIKDIHDELDYLRNNEEDQVSEGVYTEIGSLCASIRAVVKVTEGVG